MASTGWFLVGGGADDRHPQSQSDGGGRATLGIHPVAYRIDLDLELLVARIAGHFQAWQQGVRRPESTDAASRVSCAFGGLGRGDIHLLSGGSFNAGDGGVT